MGWKQVAVAVFLLLSVACEPAREEASPSVPADRSALVPPARRVPVRVLGDFSVDPALPDTRLTTVDSPSLRAGDGSVVVFALRRLRVPARCIVDVRLFVTVEEWHELAGEELALYPSHVVNALTKRDGDRYGYSGSLLDTRPRAAFDGSAAGLASWDVTAIVKRWVGGRAFPSRGVYAPDRGPVVLALRDTDLAEPFATATVASVESPHPPEGFAFVEEDCPLKGRA